MIWNETRSVQGLPDLLLPHSVIADGVVLQRDGSLTASWSYLGPDHIASTPDEVWAHSEQFNHALKLGTGWMIGCDVIRSQVREYLPYGAFPDVMSELIDEERRQQFFAAGARFQSEYFFTLTFLAPWSKEEAARGFCFDGKPGEHSGSAALDIFLAGVEGFERIAGSLCELRRLRRADNSDEQLRYIRRTVSGEDYPFASEVLTELADQIGVDFVPGVEPIVNGKHVRVIAIDGFPPISRPGILAELDRLPIEYRWHTRAIPLDPYDAEAYWASVEKQWNGVKKRGLDKVRAQAKQRGSAFAAKMEDSAYIAQSEAIEGRAQTANYTSTLVVMEEDRTRADEIARQLQKAIRNLGFGARLETINANEAWLGSIPGDGHRNVRRVMVNTLNLAHLLPTSSVWTGSPVHPSSLMPRNSPALMMAVTNGSTPFYLNTHVEDVGHTLVLGPTGAGKSTLLATLALQHLRYPGAQVFAFDRGYSIWAATMGVGGDHYDIAGPSGQFCFAPLSDLSTDSDVTWACGWIEGLCELNGLRVTAGQRNAIAVGVDRLRYVKSRTLTDFYATVQDLAVREALQHFVMTGPLGSLLDASEDDLDCSRSRWVAFETEHLLRLDAKAVIPVLLYLFRRVEKRLDGSPTLILLDEAWSYLEHPLFARQLADWLRTLRKKNAAVDLSTQQISDVSGSSISDLVLDSCPTKILLPNAEARNAREFYVKAGLNNEEIAMLTVAIPKRQYYIVSRDGRRLIDLDCGPVLLSLAGVNGGAARQRLKALIEKHPLTWRSEWLMRLGQPEWAAALELIEEGKTLCVAG